MFETLMISEQFIGGGLPEGPLAFILSPAAREKLSLKGGDSPWSMLDVLIALRAVGRPITRGSVVQFTVPSQATRHGPVPMRAVCHPGKAGTSEIHLLLRTERA